MPESSDQNIGQRKAEHLEICVDESNYEVENGTTLFDEVSFIHRALPELDTHEVVTETEFLDQHISAPIFISSMTGGSSEAFKRNKDLARVAAEAGIPVGMGSIRILLRNPEVISHFQLKQIAHDVPVFANIGGVQLPGTDLEPVIELLKRLEVDAVAVHLNPGQELAQPEGDRNFTGVVEGIALLVQKSPIPVIVKETGSGIAPDEGAKLLETGVRYIDVAGSGGTNWMTVEGYRLSPEQRRVVDEFKNWGIPTAAALRAYQTTGTGSGAVLASGGLRTGMHVAKSIALGAAAAGMALPFIRAVARDGVDGGLAYFEHLTTVLRTAMVLTGSKSIPDLRSANLITTPLFDSLAAGLGSQHRL